MADKKSGAQRSVQRRKETADGGNHAFGKTTESTGSSSNTPSGSFIYPVRSLLANVEPALEASGGQDATGAKGAGAAVDDLFALGTKDGISTASIGKAAVMFPQLSNTNVPFKSIDSSDSEEVPIK